MNFKIGDKVIINKEEDIHDLFSLKKAIQSCIVNFERKETSFKSIT